MIGASLAFTCMVAFVKVAREELPALDVVFWRAAIATPLLIPAMRGAELRLRHKKTFALRLLFGDDSLHLPVADAEQTFRWKGSCSRQQFVQQDAQRIDIAARVTMASYLFRCHVAECSGEATGRCSIPSIDLGKAKVSNPNVSTRIQQ